MQTTIDRLKLVFLCVFAVCAAAALIYHFYWVRPALACEVEQHKWWDSKGRVCAQPVLISDITGRTIDDKQAEAAARAAIGRPTAPSAAHAPAPAK